MAEFINTHCHIINFKFIPDNFFLIAVPFKEKLLRLMATRLITRLVTFIWPGRNHNRFHEVLSLMKKNIKNVANEYIQEMDDAGIVMSIPLMMDLEYATGKTPEMPYLNQVLQISEIAGEYPGKLMPFIMLDPRRRRISERITTALEEKGFLGVKMYPSLGYHPDAETFVNDADAYDELKSVYKYCAANSIPITTHCSPGGAFSLDLKDNRGLAREFANPISWEGVLSKYPQLRLNLAHFGGGEYFLKVGDPDSWATKVKELVMKYPNVYTDLANHTQALEKKTRKQYFEILKSLMEEDKVKDKIIFGTDWPISRDTWREKDYVKPFNDEKNLPQEMLQKIAFDNPLNFLFPGKKLPQRIKDFYKNNNVNLATLPQWMKDNLTI